jgi:hypothetical protein
LRIIVLYNENAFIIKNPLLFMDENTSVEKRLEDKKEGDESQEDLEELVYEGNSRLFAAAKFLDEANAENLEQLRGWEWGVARIVTLISYPFTYALSLIRAKYSPKKRGYVF